MRFTFWELYKIKKLHYITLAVLALTAVNCVFTWFGIHPDSVAPEKSVTAYIEKYKADPATERVYIEKYIADYEKAREVNPEGEAEMNKSSVYSGNDYFFFKFHILPIIDFKKNYDASLDKYIAVAKGHLAEYDYAGYDKDDFVYAYQTKIIEAYRKLYVINFPVENLQGWDEYFSSGTTPAFILLAALLIASVAVPMEKQSGALAMIRTTKNGRYRTAAAKTASVFLLCVGAVLLFSLTSLATVYFRCGLVGWDAPVQKVRDFAVCPYMLTVGGAFILNLLLRIFAACVFAAIVMAFSCISRNTLLLYGSGLALLGLNYLLGTMRFLNAYDPFKQLNLFTAANGIKIITAWQGIKLFNRCCSYVSALIIVYAALAAVSVIAVFALYPVIPPQAARTRRRLLNICLPEYKRRYRAALFPHETYKLFGVPAIAVVLLFVALDLYLASVYFVPDTSVYEKIYREYMAKLSGQYTLEKAAYIDGEFARISKIIAEYEEMGIKSESGMITNSEYIDYLRSYWEAYPRVQVIEKIVEEKAYIEQKLDEGVNSEFIYDSGWNRLLKTDYAYLPAIAVILLFADINALEYRSGFTQIQRACKKGRGSVFAAKLALTLIFSAAAALVYTLTSTAAAAVRIGLPDAGVCTASLMLLEKYSSLTIAGYFALRALKTVLIFCAIGATTFALSRVMKKNLITLVIMTAILFLPEVFSLFGVSLLDKVSALKIIRAI